MPRPARPGDGGKAKGLALARRRPHYRGRPGATGSGHGGADLGRRRERASRIDLAAAPGRAATALFGHLGLELDLLTLGPAELEELTAWIALHKRLRPILHNGQVVRGDGDPLVHGVVADDRRSAVFAVVQTASPEARLPAPSRLPGLDRDRRYRITLLGPPPPGIEFAMATDRALTSTGIVLSGGALEDAGVRLPRLLPASALLLQLDAAD